MKPKRYIRVFSREHTDHASCSCMMAVMKVKVGNDQEMAQSEIKSHSKLNEQISDTVTCTVLSKHRKPSEQLYEGHPRSNANSYVIFVTIAIFQESLHQSYDALSTFPDPITILKESHSNRRCLATSECKVNDLGHS